MVVMLLSFVSPMPTVLRCYDGVVVSPRLVPNANALDRNFPSAKVTIMPRTSGSLRNVSPSPNSNSFCADIVVVLLRLREVSQYRDGLGVVEVHSKLEGRHAVLVSNPRVSLMRQEQLTSSCRPVRCRPVQSCSAVVVASIGISLKPQQRLHGSHMPESRCVVKRCVSMRPPRLRESCDRAMLLRHRTSLMSPLEARASILAWSPALAAILISLPTSGLWGCLLRSLSLS
mmetsp:Transcript_12209/g.42518  ORF Transcript_12209/g.42518 Transcript_12209/m.42518 type:complete len:230 (+) Transcript_12209:1393-2082(+)